MSPYFFISVTNMENIQEFRYPFESFIDFFSGGYWIQIQGLHLTFGWLGLLVMSLFVFSRHSSLYIKFTTIYFAAFVFNNYAYSLANIRISDFFGIIIAILSLKLIGKNLFRQSMIGYALLLIGFAAFIHIIIIKIIYPELDNQIEQFFIRITLVGRICVLGLVTLRFDQEFNTGEKINQLIKDIVYFGLVSIAVYLIQVLVLATGNLPFGTFLDAGFTGFPSFGSVSIERGHFAKLFVPLFPFYAIFTIKEKKIVIFLLYLLINLINFSASGQVFLVCYLLLFAFYYRGNLLKWYNYFFIIFLSSFLYIVTTNFFTEQVLGVVEKINRLGLQGDDEGGRGFDVFQQYIETYPLGTSYGGSTLRIVTDLPEINLGIYAFIVQFSILSIPLIIGFIYLNYMVIIKSNFRVEKDIRNALLIGILVSGVIYCIDILWFTPTIWLPLIICHRLSQLSKPRNNELNYLP